MLYIAKHIYKALHQKYTHGLGKKDWTTDIVDCRNLSAGLHTQPVVNYTTLSHGASGD